MQPSERDSAALTSPHTDTASSSLSGDSGGRVVHPVVAAVLAVTPRGVNGLILARAVHYEMDGKTYGYDEYAFPDEEIEIAARQAAEVLRWASGVVRCDGAGKYLAVLADELDPKEETTDA